MMKNEKQMDMLYLPGKKAIVRRDIFAREEKPALIA